MRNLMPLVAVISVSILVGCAATGTTVSPDLANLLGITDPEAAPGLAPRLDLAGARERRRIALETQPAAAVLRQEMASIEAYFPQCGEDRYARMVRSAGVVWWHQLKGLKFVYGSGPVTDVDRLNGVAAAGTLRIDFDAQRYRRRGEFWSKWSDASMLPPDGIGELGLGLRVTLMDDGDMYARSDDATGRLLSRVGDPTLFEVLVRDKVAVRQMTCADLPT